MIDRNQAVVDFLTEMEEGSLNLDEALQDYGHLLEDSDVDQACKDYMDARAAIKKTLKRIAKDNNMDYAADLLD